MNINAAFPSDYLKAADLQNKEWKLTMDRVEMIEIGGDQKPCLFFQRADRGLILNKTNANTISEEYGEDTEGWRGKELVLFPTKTEFQGKRVPCIRVEIASEFSRREAEPPQEGPPPVEPEPAADDSIPF